MYLYKYLVLSQREENMNLRYELFMKGCVFTHSSWEWILSWVHYWTNRLIKDWSTLWRLPTLRVLVRLSSWIQVDHQSINLSFAFPFALVFWGFNRLGISFLLLVLSILYVWGFGFFITLGFRIIHSQEQCVKIQPFMNNSHLKFIFSSLWEGARYL